MKQSSNSLVSVLKFVGGVALALAFFAVLIAGAAIIEAQNCAAGITAECY